MKTVLVLLFSVGALASFGIETVTLDLPAGGSPGTRAYQDLPVTPELVRGGAVGFDICVSEPLAVSSYVCYFRSGNGWYKASFVPVDGDVDPNRTYRVTLTTADILATEGEPAGWSKVDRVRFAAYRGSTRASKVVISALSGETVRRDVLFVRGSTAKDDSDAPYVNNMRKAFEKLGVASSAVVDADVDEATLEGVKLVVLAHTPRLSSPTLAALERFVARGGRLFAAYGVPARVARLLQVELPRCVRPTGADRLAGFAAGDEPLPDQPPFAPQASWMCQQARPTGEARVAAWWRTTDGRVTDLPALVVSPYGAYLSHVWLGADSPEQLRFFAAVADRLLPGTRERFAATLERYAREQEAQRAEVAAMPGKANERRFIWCHSAWGLGGSDDWDSSCRFVKANGFTDLIVNLAWGGCAFYPSKVLPRSESGPRGDALETCKTACRRHGLKMHVWKVCWNQGGHSPKAFADAQTAAKRVCVRRDGLVQGKWNCPSDPHNRDLEIAAMTELALEKGVDGIHFDYIRYDGPSVCFCAGCRNRFEAKLGRKVAQWPADLSSDASLAAAWKAFRRDNISAVVKAVSEKVRAAGSPVEISAAVFPNFETTADTIGQDWLAWCRAGWLDFVCPMDYIPQPRLFAERVRQQRDALKDCKTRLYPGLAIDCSHFQNIGIVVPAREIVSIRELGLDGFTLFHLGERAKTVLPELRAGPLR